MIRNDMNQIKISSYSDILSSTASSIKTREMPILIRQDCMYEPELNASEKFEKTKSTHTTFKTSSINSKKGISSGGTLNAAFNQHEPLSANSETNFSHSDKLLIYDDPKILNNQQPNSNIVFRNHLDNCNSSLVKLVTISQQISNLAESNKVFSNLNLSNTGTATPTENHTYNTVLNDSSLVSESVDNFNGHEDYYDECNFANTSRDEVNNVLVDSSTELYANHKKVSSKPPVGFRDTRKNSPITNNCTINTTFSLDVTSASTPSSSSNYNNLESSNTTNTKNDSLNSNYFNNTSTNTNTNSSKNSNEGLITKFSIINVEKNESSSNMKTFSHGINNFWGSIKSEANSNIPMSRINLIKQKLGVESNSN